MLNENYRKYIGGLMSGVSGLTNLTPYSKNCNAYDTPFTTATWTSIVNMSDYDTKGVMVVVGSGDTKPTPQDIQLENIINNLTCVTASTVQGTIDYVKIVSATYKNNTANTITVKEIGLIVQSSAYSGSCYYRVLLGRIVLDAPVVMTPGDTYTFNYCIE